MTADRLATHPWLDLGNVLGTSEPILQDLGLANHVLPAEFIKPSLILILQTYPKAPYQESCQEIMIPWVEVHKPGRSFPYVFATCYYNSPLEGKNLTPSTRTTQPICWGNGEDLGCLPILAFQKILYPFVDVICVSNTAFKNVDAIVSWLSLLADHGNKLATRTCKPRIVELSKHYIDPNDFSPVSSHFSKLKIVFSSSDSSSEMVVQNFGDVLRKEAEAMRQSLRSGKMLFSLQHWLELFETACVRFSDNPKSTSVFDFVAAARTQNPNPVPKELALHLTEYSTKAGLTSGDTSSIIASALVMNAYPPSMHLFPAMQTFNSLYSSICQSAIPDQLIDVRKKFCLYSKQIIKKSTPSATAHRSRLKRHTFNHKSFATCAGCVSRTIEVRFGCGHALCDICIQIHGIVDETTAYTYHIQNCLFCDSKIEVTMKFKPPTAGPRILSIDGGGIRGIIPIQFLRVLQEKMGLPVPIQDHFDAAYGSSAGGLIVLLMSLNGWTVEKCEEEFVAMAKQSFKLRTTFWGIPIIGPLQRLLVSYLADSRYSKVGVANAMSRVFEEKKLMDWSYANRIGCKVGVTATTASKAFPCIFTNYSKSNCRDKGYRIVPCDYVSVKDAALSTSAAPWFFNSHKVKDVGTFMDGGLWQNNPADVAVWETRQLHPDSQVPDIVLSIGTGYLASTPKQTTGRHHSPVTPQSPEFNLSSRNGFVPRLYRSFMTSLDGQKAWCEVLNRLPEDMHQRYVRLNSILTTQEPELDNISAIEPLKVIAREDAQSHELGDLILQMKASTFYVELDSKPMCRNGEYKCSAHIYNRLGGKALSTLLSGLFEENFKFYIDGHTAMDVMTNMGGVKIQFSVLHLDWQFNISIGRIQGTSKSLSGFPTSVGQLITRQGLDTEFGHVTHRKRRAHEPFSQSKKRRLA